ncbi:signal peptidase I [Brachybacterium nesterenkovii]|uniref:Signal peptidase I n=1 Tax=Brachybacterium nesterenkovii TaxID=47847 RepID=A0A1X6WWU9_9MICO|nr:signal peptidase I [Brachybacterium nesterenkovii]SLM89125.1 Signal peptidase I [Brachybacterium nesterenkovii]
MNETSTAPDSDDTDSVGTDPRSLDTEGSAAEGVATDGSASESSDSPDTAGSRSSARSASSHGRRRARRRSSWLDYIVTLVVALVIAVLVKTFLIQPFFIPSTSMVPTLETDDKILVSKLTPGVFDLERGDVVVFEDSLGWIADDPGRADTARYKVSKVLSYVGLAPDPGEDHLVKRLIGMPGDHVVCAEEGGPLQVNGVTLDEPYINPDNGACQYAFDVTVPDGKVWVMGDNRFNSADSAYHDHELMAAGQDPSAAFVPESDITGKAVVIMWPATRWTGLGGGEDTFADVPDPA